MTRNYHKIVADALASIQFIDDPTLRVFAFEKNLDTLLKESPKHIGEPK